MDIRELRFGNLLQWKDDRGNIRIGAVGMLMPEQIGVVELGGVALRLMDKDILEPIPLTLEWLSRFEWRTLRGIESVFHEGRLQIEMADADDILFRYRRFVEDVHTLQNFHYWLEGYDATLLK